jgi:hypothetical protein
MSKEQGAKIHEQLAAIMADVEAVGKERRNINQNFNFRGIEDVVNALHPVFASHKVFILSEVTAEKTEERTTAKGGNLIYRLLTVKVSYVSGIDGSRETVTVTGEGMDSGDKAANKAMSAALKYALTQTLLLPFASFDDGDQDSQPPSTPKAQATGGGERRSAYDGRKLAPGEAPEPKAEPKAKTLPTDPTVDREPATDPTAFAGPLYDMLAMSGVAKEDLTAYLILKGIMAKGQALDNLPANIVTAICEGKDPKTRRPNWEVIEEGIAKMKGQRV